MRRRLAHGDSLRTVGIEQFASDSPVLASNHCPSFLDPTVLPQHTLCQFLDIQVPSYKPTLVPNRHRVTSAHISSDKTRPWTGLTIIHTAGHTPDEIAIWDEGERVLYVGDTLYEWAPIIFPKEGSIIAWLKSVDELLQLVGTEMETKICCGHVTAGKPARDVINGAKLFMMDVLTGREEAKQRGERRGEAFVQYIQEGYRFSLACPERLIREAQNALKIA